ncbi:serine hydrolase [Streptomyces inhibens]|uniref:serine hydrolase n=1 Tax=Streptomyces inhibens TaxID=2293571 RepID=UPI003CC9BD0C|nr:serine hydrolase [Streptomyces inhibens]
MRYQPGSKGTYRSIDTELLGQVLAKVEGQPLANLLARNIWAPMGRTGQRDLEPGPRRRQRKGVLLHQRHRPPLCQARATRPE